MQASEIFETPEASGFSEVEKTFVEKQKEMASTFIKKNALGLVCECGGGGTDGGNETCTKCGGCGIYEWSVYKMDTLTETIIHNVLAEVERVVEGEHRQVEYRNYGFVASERDLENHGFNQALTTIIGEEHWEEFVRGHEEGKTGYYVWDVIRFVRERG